MATARNMLVILADGLRADAYGAARLWPIDTADLDALLHEGLATVAVAAAPDRVGGQIALHTGLHVRQHARTAGSGKMERSRAGWVSRLREAGYFCAGVGQVRPVADHLDASCVVAGPDELDERACAYLRFADHVGLGEPVRRARLERLRRGPFGRERGPVEPMHDVDGFIADQAEQMFIRLPKGRPWLFVVALTGPGNDLPAPAAMREQVGRDGLDNDFVPAGPGELDDRIHYDFPRTLLQNITLEQARQLRRDYLARVLMLDGLVGRLRESLDERGWTESTWVVLASSRGKLLGEFGLFGGWSMLSGAIYTPLWLTAPPKLRIKGQPDDASADGLVSTVDLAATLCEIGQVDPPTGCAGRSILPALAGQSIGHDAVICEAGSRLMLETLRHRVIFDVETGRPRLLFDLSADPGERYNLVGQSRQSDILDSLRMRLANVLMPLRPV